jgi:hypothetical protein
MFFATKSRATGARAFGKPSSVARLERSIHGGEVRRARLHHLVPPQVLLGEVCWTSNVKISSDQSVLLLERSEVGPPGTPADEDILINVTVEVRGFAAADQSWIMGTDWRGFLAELRALETRRAGFATLVAASPEDLRLEFFSTDRAGHMAVRGQVGRRTTERFDLQLRFGFPFEPDELPRILRELEAFTPLPHH